MNSSQRVGSPQLATYNGERVASGGDGPHDPHMEARVAKLEASMEHVQQDVRDIKIDVREIKSNARTDFRLLFGALIAAALGLAALMAHGFHWL